MSCIRVFTSVCCRLIVKEGRAHIADCAGSCQYGAPSPQTCSRAGQDD